MSVKEIFEKLTSFGRQVLEKTRAGVLWQKACARLKQSKRSLLWIVPMGIILYYLLGAWVTNEIDKNPDLKVEKSEGQMASVEIIKDLVKRETRENMWTPSLPIIFPGYILDNMPSFQTGLMESLAQGTKVLAKLCPDENLTAAAEFLSYPPDLWLFTTGKNLLPAPSSVAQYHKAHKALHRFSRGDQTCLTNAPIILSATLPVMRRSLAKSMAEIEVKVREESTTWGDTDADKVFYKAQGRIYGVYAVLKGFEADYGSWLAKNDLYGAYTSLEKTLADALRLEPLFVRNGTPEALTAPNHLLNLGYYIGKAMSQLTDLIYALQR